MGLRPYDNLLAELEDACGKTGVVFEEVRTALLGLFGDDKIAGYYINRGANPHSPNMILDIFALSVHCLYNYEIHKDRSACHIVFLDSIIQLAETEVTEEGDYFAVQIRTSTIGGGLTLHEKITAREKVRVFCQEMKNAVINMRPVKKVDIE